VGPLAVQARFTQLRPVALRSFVLDQLLSGNARDEVIEAIHSHVRVAAAPVPRLGSCALTTSVLLQLRKIAADVRANRIALNKYIVIKVQTRCDDIRVSAQDSRHLTPCLHVCPGPHQISAGLP